MHHPTDRIAHTTAFVTPVVEHWLEREIAKWVHHMKDRSDDPSHHDTTTITTTTSIIIAVIFTRRSFFSVFIKYIYILFIVFESREINFLLIIFDQTTKIVFISE